MDLPVELHIIHQPARLKIMVLLYKRGDISASAAREALGLTAGNLESHVKRLADDDLVEARRVLLPGGFELRYRPTREGLHKFARYLDWLEAFAADVG